MSCSFKVRWGRTVCHSWIVAFLVPCLLLGQTQPAAERRSSPKDELLDAVYVGYFLPNGLRELTSEEGWTNIRRGAEALRQHDPSDKTLEMVVHFIDGELARISKNYDLAETEFRAANKTDPNLALPFFGLAETAMEKGDTSLVSGLLYAASFVVPKSIPPSFQHLAFSRLGELYERVGKYTEAVKSYESAARANPKWGGGHTKLAETYLKLNQPDIALPHIQQAITLSPKEAHNYAVLGRVQSRLGHHPSALTAFQKAVALEPGDAAYHVSLGLEYESTGAKTSALHSYMTAQMIAEKDKSYADLLPEIGQALSRLQK
jgi:tetratricopeptide (TPR) repeat protein